MNATAAMGIRRDPVVAMFLDKVRAIRSQLKALYLFGSRVRDDWRPDSDYDILVIVQERGRALVDSLYDAVTDVVLETGSLVSLKILTQAQYDRLAAIPTPFIANIMKEGVELGLYDERAH